MTIAFRAFSALAGTAFLSACVLSVDQDRYGSVALDELEGSQIAGPPEGDRFGVMFPDTFITTPAGAAIGKAVEIGEHAEFNTRDHAPPASYLVKWSGERDSTSDAATDVVLRDDAGHVAIRVRLSRNILSVVSGTEHVPERSYTIGGIHDISVTLKMTGAGAPRADVAITNNGQELAPLNGLAFVDSDFHQLDVVEVDTGPTYYMRDLIAFD